MKRFVFGTVLLACSAVAVWGLEPARAQLEQTRLEERQAARPQKKQVQLEQMLSWPAPAAPVVLLPPLRPDRPLRIYLDAGHGAPDNSGNVSSLCEDEQDFTFSLARDVAEQLTGFGGFEIALSRDRADARVAYAERVAAAERWNADAFVSLHSDVRGEPESPAAGCLRSREAPGFSVLWSDEGSPELGRRRRALAGAVSRGLMAMALPAYGGAQYQGLYETDRHEPGVFVDRHDPARRIFVLRRPRMPSVLIETHNARDDREARRWREPAVRRAFAAALARALTTALGASPTPSPAEPSR